MPFDAFLLVSYGAPERQEDVVPFLQNLFHGKDVPASRIDSAAQKYHRNAQRTGHYSPLNTECRALQERIRHSFHSACSGDTIKCYWGNLFWHPLLKDTFDEMRRDGVENVLYFVTSVFDSYNANQRYDEAVATANRNGALTLTKFPPPFRHPLFIKAQANALLTAAAWAELEMPNAKPVIMFSAHSIPKQDAATSNYVTQLQEACRSVADVCGIRDWELVFQSRSGPSTLWLEPDIRDRIREIAAEGKYEAVVVSPIGFLCENMETVYDLDVEVAEWCAECGLGYFRAQTVGSSPEMTELIVNGGTL